MARIESGKNFRCDERPPANGEVGVVKVSAVTRGEFNEREAKTCTDQDRVDPKAFIKPGDLLLGRASGSLSLVGRAVIVKSIVGRVMLSDKVLRLVLQGIDPRWVLYALRSPFGRDQVERLASGIDMHNIGQDRIRRIWVPVPPEPAQARLVDEIEKQFTRLDAGLAAFSRLQSHLRRYRAAVLKSASEGTLGNRPPSLPTASRSGGVEGPHPVPAGWRWGLVGSVVAAIEAGKNFRCVEHPPAEGEFGVVKVSAVTWGAFDQDESKTATDGARLDERLLVRPGDFLFSRANTIGLVGTCVIVGSVQRKVMLSDKILRLTVSGADPRWLMWMLRSPVGRQEIERLATGNQESMRNIGQDRIREIRIPLPPLLEQEALVREIEVRLDAATRVDDSASAGLRRARRLQHAILDEALSGRLTARDGSRP